MSGAVKNLMWPTSSAVCACVCVCAHVRGGAATLLIYLLIYAAAVRRGAVPGWGPRFFFFFSLSFFIYFLFPRRNPVILVHFIPQRSHVHLFPRLVFSSQHCFCFRRLLYRASIFVAGKGGGALVCSLLAPLAVERSDPLSAAVGSHRLLQASPFVFLASSFPTCPEQSSMRLWKAFFLFYMFYQAKVFAAT